jgi:cap2 methyltransferase
MVELLHVLDFFKRHTTTIRSAHVCEGPGGFIEALLYIATKKSIQVSNSWAMTLKPSMPNIPGWKRAYTFLRKSPMVTIEYGADETGNIMIPANQAKYLQRSRGKCQIFTADGGFDFSEHYSTQEDEVFPLLVSSSLIGLQTLVKGGDFILKVFDTELKSTNDLLAILACCFDSWTLYKPSLSRPCNAEKYFLGRGCRAIPPWVLRTLTEIQTKNSMSLRHIFPSLPEELSSTLFSRKTEYLEQQIAAVEYAISNNESWNKDQFTIWKSIYEHSVQWCQEFKLPIKAGHQFVV